MSTAARGVMASEETFRQRFCRGVDCGEMFFVCQPCYRGQAYCSDSCRQERRRQQRRKANQRYNQDPEVRRDHGVRQQEYLERCRLRRVTDQSSIVEWGSGSIGEPRVTDPESTAVEETHAPSKPTWIARLGRVVCLICGRVGKFVASFVRRE